LQAHRIRERHPAPVHRTEGIAQALENAFKYNLSDYRDTIPQVFWYNAVIISVERLEEQDRQHDCGLGTLRRMEEDQ
jgi:hypothetical protein